jgi:hypothetical protein
MSKAPKTTKGISAWRLSKHTRAMKINTTPVANSASGLARLCLVMYEGSKLETPITIEMAMKAHSVRSSANKPSPNNGSVPITRGITAQCAAHAHEAKTPSRSSELSFPTDEILIKRNFSSEFEQAGFRIRDRPV